MTTQAYRELIARIESSNRPYIKAKTSTASGLYQFVKDTWITLGGRWGNDSSQAFGGLRPSIEEQNRMFDKLTTQNANALRRRNIPINEATLYGYHFLGPRVEQVLLAPDNANIRQYVTAKQASANPGILDGTVRDFKNWLQRKTGVSPSHKPSR